MRNTFDSRGARWRSPGLTATLLLALLLPACGDSTTNLPSIPRSNIVVGVEPNPVIGTQNILTGSVSAAYVVQIREVAGLGATITFVNSTVFDPATGIQVISNYFDSANLKVFVGSDRVEPGGALDVTQTTSYTLPDFLVDADMVVTLQAIDDQGNLINRSTLVRIVPPE